MPNPARRFTVRRLEPHQLNVVQPASHRGVVRRQGAVAGESRGAETRLKRLLRDGCAVGLFQGARCVGVAAVDVARAELLGPFFPPPGSARTSGADRSRIGSPGIPLPAGRRLVEACERLAARFQLFELVSRPPPEAEICLEACGYARAQHPWLHRRFPRRQTRFGRRVREACEELGIAGSYGRDHRLPLQPEAESLVSAGKDVYDRAQRLSPGAATAWRALRAAASGDGVTLQLVSAFRSVNYQAGLLRRKLEQGQELARILEVSAAPGFSEHHTGRALDLTTPGSPVLEEAFEETPAFDWLSAHAPDHGFRMSFPRNNRHGVLYEPWHWFYVG